jgi:glycerol-3-phosphate dehydrogenase (NAD(P)+)
VTRIAILGGGSWGTALAVVLSRRHRTHDISLWVHDGDLAEKMQRVRENVTHLPGHTLSERVRITHEIDKAVADAEIILGAMPSANAREVYSMASTHISARPIFISGTKGLEPLTHARMSQVLGQVLAGRAQHVAVLSGPSFAQEVAQGVPTASVLACHDTTLADDLREQLAAPNFRLYTNDDVLGVELAGPMKNVIAIAAGTLYGLGLGSNPLAALITRGLAEMSRLAITLGARPETLSGLAGLGDLVLTCTGSLSRNRWVGIEMAKGRTLSEILSTMHGIAEGVGTTAALLALARESKVEMPITEQVDAILHKGKRPPDAIRDIMERPLKRE